MIKISIIVLCVCITSSVQASVRSLYQEKSRLFLHEKVAKPENLLDNPARLSGIANYYIEDDVEIRTQTTKPYDFVYKKENHNDLIKNTSQVIVPIKAWAVINAGYGYNHLLNIWDTFSTFDKTRIYSADKTHARTINAAIATDKFSFPNLGYAIQLIEHTHAIDYAADIANDYTYANLFNSTRHSLGMVKNNIELFGGIVSESYTGDYNKEREIEFLMNSWEVHARCVFGSMEKESVLLQAGLISSQLDQQLFTIGRSGYDLDISNYQLSANSYYAYFGEHFDLAAGIELDYTDSTLFDVSDYQWENYQVLRGVIPVQINMQILSGFKLWLEMDLVYQQNLYEKSSVVTLQNSIGITLDYDMLEIQCYILPEINITNSESSDSSQSIQSGLTASVHF